MFNIIKRIKHIDDSYYIVYNYKRNKWEVHSSSQENSYCLTCPYDSLDSRLLDYVYRTSLIHNPDLIRDIEKDNEMLERDKVQDRSDYIMSNLDDIYSVLSNSSKEYDWDKMMKTKWL